jgi:hypothetical protein
VAATLERWMVRQNRLHPLQGVTKINVDVVVSQNGKGCHWGVRPLGLLLMAMMALICAL